VYLPSATIFFGRLYIVMTMLPMTHIAINNAIAMATSFCVSDRLDFVVIAITPTLKLSIDVLKT
jgi:hypothetical protein